MFSTGIFATNRAIGFGYATALILSVVFVFRHFFFSGFDLVLADLGDARIMMTLLEHWRSVFRGEESWGSPIFFYPVKGVLGMTDAHALLGWIYWLFRFFFDEYISYELTLMVTRALGFGFMALLLRDGLKLPHPIAILGATLFTVLGVNYHHSFHGQFVSVSYIPLIVWLSIVFFRSEAGTRASWLAGMGLGLVYGLLCLTTYYLAWFFAVGAIVFSFLAAAYAVIAMGARGALAAATGWITARSAQLLAMAGALALPLCFFIYLYFPKFAEHGGQPLATAMADTQSLWDIINAGRGNWVWGWLLSPDHNDRMRINPGFSLVFLLLTATTIAFNAVILVRRPAIDDAALWRSRFAVLIGIAGVLFWLACLRFGDISLYPLLFKYVPGGSVIRVPARLPLFLGALFVPIAMIGFYQLTQLGRRRKAGTIAAMVLACVVLAEQGMRPGPRMLRTQELTLLAQVPPPPSSCKSFFVEGFMRRPDETWDLLQRFYGPTTDAMLLAYRFRIPTFQGISSILPPGWNLVLPPLGENYLSNLSDWVKRYHLADVCKLDLSQRQWSPVKFD